MSTYPFLTAIPQEYLGCLDADELVCPEGCVPETTTQLADELNAHVVIYKFGRPERQNQKMALCELVHPAALNERELALLSELQMRIGAGVLVAYAKPLRLRLSQLPNSLA